MNVINAKYLVSSYIITEVYLLLVGLISGIGIYLFAHGISQLFN